MQKRTQTNSHSKRMQNPKCMLLFHLQVFSRKKKHLKNRMATCYYKLGYHTRELHFKQHRYVKHGFKKKRKKKGSRAMVDGPQDVAVVWSV